MKKPDVLLLLTTLAYSYLFYGQGAGINVFLFSCLLTGCLLVQDPERIRNLRWAVTATSTLFSAGLVAVIHTDLSLFAHFISVVLLIGFSWQPHASLFTSVLNTLHSVACSWFIKLRVLTSKLKHQTTGEQESAERKTRLNVVLATVIPGVIILFFFQLYRMGNPIFDGFVKSIPLDFMSTGRLLFTLSGFTILLGVFWHYAVETFTEKDLATPDRLIEPGTESTWSENRLDRISSERVIALVSLALLNGLLFFVNILDAYYLYISSELPEGMSYSQHVHSGVYTLIASIALAVCIILYFFRGDLNFIKDKKSLVHLAYAWILLNIVMVLSTATRNHLYIEEYGLTHKRIGVYVYLMLCLLGLVITFLKVYRTNSNWFLFRKMAWASFAVLLLASCFNWNRIILDFNLAHSKTPDMNYLFSLEENTLIELAQVDLSDYPNSKLELQKEWRGRARKFEQTWQQQDWQSWNRADALTYEYLRENGVFNHRYIP